MSGTTLPSSSMCAFHSVNAGSSSSGSCPRSASRTGAESAVIRYWYHEISHTTVTTTSAFTPESGWIETCGVPRLFAIPPIVRRYCDALKRSAASTIASSSSDSRRRNGSLAIGAAAAGRSPRNEPSEKRLRFRSGAIVGVVGDPSFSQPYSSAVSRQSVQTSTKESSPFGEYLVVRSPISSVRSQIAQRRSVETRVTRTDPSVAGKNACSEVGWTPGQSPPDPSAAPAGGALSRNRLFLLLRRLDQFLGDVRRDFLVAEEFHVVVAAPACHRGQRLRVREHLRHRHLGANRRHPALRLHPLEAPAA